MSEITRPPYPRHPPHISSALWTVSRQRWPLRVPVSANPASVPAKVWRDTARLRVDLRTSSSSAAYKQFEKVVFGSESLDITQIDWGQYN